MVHHTSKAGLSVLRFRIIKSSQGQLWLEKTRNSCSCSQTQELPVCSHLQRAKTAFGCWVCHSTITSKTSQGSPKQERGDHSQGKGGAQRTRRQQHWRIKYKDAVLDGEQIRTAAFKTNQHKQCKCSKLGAGGVMTGRC